jgi:hypothetical protein
MSRKLPPWVEVSLYIINDLTWHELMLLCDWRVQSGVWFCGDDAKLKWYRGGVEEWGRLSVLPWLTTFVVCDKR